MGRDRETLFGTHVHRRGFLGWCARGLATLASIPLFSAVSDKARAAGTVTPSGPGPYTLLKNGLVVDGTGAPGFTGSVLLAGDRIEAVTTEEMDAPGDVIDCTDRVIAPGFIDMHSHMDWFLPVEGRPELKAPFINQGITTFVAGNCGYGVAGFMKDSPHMDLITDRTRGLYELNWRTMDEYFDRIEAIGLSHNLANLAGHGTTRASIRGFDASPLSTGEMDLMLGLLEEAMDMGACGVSLGLQYEPGVFATLDELREVARLIKNKDKILTVHMKAYSTLSGTYPLKLFGTPHNLLAIEDMLQVARDTGVRLQLSHLIFVGSLTWKNYEEALAMIDQAITEGLDVKFDTYAYHCGTSHINVFMPEWFLADAPEVYEDRKALGKLKRQITLMESLLGFGYEQIQITDAKHEELNQYNGMFLADIARERGMKDFENYIDFARKSNGLARVLNHRYSNPEIVDALMAHPASLFMTDASPVIEGVQNPGTFGCFPKFLMDARNRNIIPLEEVIYKMTGGTAERFGVAHRGLIKEGMAADIVVFDPYRIADNNTLTETDRTPTGIDAVFINGVRVATDGVADGDSGAGMVDRLI
ncbi:MAG: amidohydrolase family protein [Deltaproteobacteria bacterium]|nr:amidohydrolase family protein [Candidatus Zymogenaceae bacterium]